MTSHSAEDKAHWFLPDGEVGGGFDGATQGRVKEAARGKKKKCCCSGVCSCVLSVRRAICIHAAQLMLGGSICSTCALWVMQSECQCIHVCLMSVSMPPCTACPDNGRCCFVAECSDTVITGYTINWIVNVQYFKYFFFFKKGFSSWNDATQFPKCHSRGTMHPVHPVHPVLSSLLGVFFFFFYTVTINIPPAELQS